MADAVTSQILHDAVGSRHAIVKFTNISDGAGEASGYNGDIDLTTIGHTSADHYTIVMKLKKTY